MIRPWAHAAGAMVGGWMLWMSFGAWPAAARGPAYDPHIDPAHFRATVDHPFLPLEPGTAYKYVERAGRETSENEVTVMKETKTIMGVACTVVHDVVREDGEIREDTYDWYAQDQAGNVWYFGEDTKEFKGPGRVDTAGSWEAGVGVNRPGIVLPAVPAPGKPYRQEYSPGVAEDMGQVIAVGETVTVPLGTYKDCVRTKEWSLLEAGAEKKWYARGVGVVRTESSNKDVSVLVSFSHP